MRSIKDGENERRLVYHSRRAMAFAKDSMSAALHLSNRALGLMSLDALETGRVWFLRLWRNPLGTAALYTSLLVHILLALWSLYRRRTLRMPAWEGAQFAIGLAIPARLALHVVGTRLAYEWYGQADAYSRVVLSLWELRPWLGARQAAVLTIAWLHGSIGLHFWKFTTRAEHRLPYDVVFFLNRYFEAVGHAIESAGGITNQFRAAPARLADLYNLDISCVLLDPESHNLNLKGRHPLCQPSGRARVPERSAGKRQRR